MTDPGLFQEYTISKINDEFKYQVFQIWFSISVGGMNRSHRLSQGAKKVTPPSIPGFGNHRGSGSSFGSDFSYERDEGTSHLSTFSRAPNGESSASPGKPCDFLISAISAYNVWNLVPNLLTFLKIFRLKSVKSFLLVSILWAESCFAIWTCVPIWHLRDQIRSSSLIEIKGLWFHEQLAWAPTY